ncbi:MAG: hypothetical protein F6K44_08475 [Moorea sp. SIO3E2]|nr:hypothetical protein [Moorena sp. SIO3E2]
MTLILIAMILALLIPIYEAWRRFHFGQSTIYRHRFRYRIFPIQCGY